MLVGGLTASLMFSALPVLPAAAAPAAAAGTGTGVVDEATALAQAKASGESVEVTADRSEYTTTEANPDGTFTLTQSSTPQRVKREDGSWGAVDPTLERRSDGHVVPKGAVVDLSFSGGGPGVDMLRLGKDGRSIGLGWADTLPEPTLDGATATYPNVFEGVDLQLTATAEGYREVLVVKTPEAAQNPALEHVELTALGDGLTLVPGAGGGLRAVDEDGNALFRGPAGQMWDSAGDPESGQQTQLMAATGASSSAAPEEDPSHPGDGDASAVLPVKVDDDTVAVQPDLDLLRGEDTVYPVYIDPSVGLGAQERTKISSDGDKFWMFDGDKGVGKCGTADGYTCGGGYIDRMYFEFAPTKLAGKYVLDATFRARETWSFNCDPHWVDLERTDNISEGTRWPGPSQLDQMGDRYVSAGRGSLCSPDQPDAWIEFNDNPDESDENLKNTVRSFADGKIDRLTLMLRAKDEGDPRAWKRFDDNAELQVTFAYKPGVPTDVGIIPGEGTTAYCKKSSSDPLIATRKNPIAQARVQTQVESNKGAEEGSLQAEYVVERGDDAAWHQVWTGHMPDTGWHPDGTLEKLSMSDRADGGLYRYKARTQSHWSYAGKSGDLFSAYSAWCYFKIDSSVPKAPRITAGSPYTQCSANLCEGQGGPGVPGSFTFQPNTADIKANGTTDVTAYEWKLLSTPAKPVSGGLKVTVSSVTPPLSGTQVLSVRAKDVYNRWGEYQEFVFKVAPAQGEVGRWHLDGIPGSGTMTAKDTATVGTRHDATLFGVEGTGWSTRARRGEADYALRLNDDTSDPAKQTGYAATSAPAVNTRDSFTVSAWVQLSNASANRAVLSAPGENGSSFTLYYSAAYKKWVFNRTDKDAASPVYIRSLADHDDPALNVWTHVAGVFKTEGDDNLPDTDPANDTIQLFINGRPQGQPVLLAMAAPTYTPWTATGGLQFGRAKAGGKGVDHHFGLLDEVAVWQRALQPAEVAEEARVLRDGVPANELVAHWDATTAKGTQVTETTAYPLPAMTLSGSGATLNEEDNALFLDGAAGYAAATGPVVDETGSFTVSVGVRLKSADLDAKPVGYQAQVAAQRLSAESSWALWVMKPGDGVYQWKFTRTALGPDGKITQSAQVPAADVAATDTWVQITGTFDAQETWEWTNPTDGTTQDRYGRIHLYVGEFDQPSDETPGFTAPQQGGGELSLGRGTASGKTGNYLPGALRDLRLWTGAMTADQVRSQVLDTPDAV
ncbi:LamG domain-containing protein [Streptomyces dubilierae]|uniref:LamG-like jellyroll fold domain-containing protein n=1 Tax=Streptomyces dubilierae TaxID=3075533 RepID=A0ABU2PL10_9ACTN|nr:LamG-like jellyroll fold domain-containing protein [Streptomyces sp. DSM 41921]MDT0392359.1 LamG-like jellyroll fold domain-containing protein [Streptomyces sp. DSM 41921]